MDKEQIRKLIEKLQEENQILWADAQEQFKKVEACNLGICDDMKGTPEEQQKLKQERIDDWGKATLTWKHNLVTIYNLERISND